MKVLLSSFHLNDHTLGFRPQNLHCLSYCLTLVEKGSTAFLFCFFFLQILELLPNLVLCLQHPYCAVRHLAARCVGVLSVVSTQETMKMVVEDVLPLLGTADLVRNRQGAIEAISCIFFVLVVLLFVSM